MLTPLLLSLNNCVSILLLLLYREHNLFINMYLKSLLIATLLLLLALGDVQPAPTCYCWNKYWGWTWCSGAAHEYNIIGGNSSWTVSSSKTCAYGCLHVKSKLRFGNSSNSNKFYSKVVNEVHFSCAFGENSSWARCWYLINSRSEGGS